MNKRISTPIDCISAPIAAQPSAMPRLYAWFVAVAAEDTALLSDLLAHGVPIDITHPLRHSTALTEATRRGCATLVHWLLERGAAPDLLCGQPVTSALHTALRCHHWHIAMLLTHRLVHCAGMDGFGASPLHVLCAEANTKLTKDIALGLATLFLAKGCPLDSLDVDGTTALHHCVINNHYALAHMLLMRGANPNALVPDSGVSPLVIAALEKNMSMAQLLLDHGGDPTIKTNEGATAVSIHPAIGQLGAHCISRAQAEEDPHILSTRAEQWRWLLMSAKPMHHA